MLTNISTKDEVLDFFDKWLKKEYFVIDEDDALVLTISALIGSVSQSFSGAPSVAPVRAAAPVASAPAPQGGANVCKHGPMAYKEGVSAKGPWKGYMCQAPKGAPDKCQTIWVR